MKIGGLFSHKDGEKFITSNRQGELADIYKAVSLMDAGRVLTKQSAEKTKVPLLFSPPDMNTFLKENLSHKGWTEPAPKLKKGFREPRISLEGNREFREMDGIKNKVGLEIQFGKYAFMGYDIFSKMIIFSNRNLIDCGIELVVMPSMIKDMSTGVSSFNQIVMDMKARGEANIDIPTLILGIEPTQDEWSSVKEKRERFKKFPQKLIENGEVKANRKGAKPGPK